MLHCGDEYIIAAEETLREAELEALERARDLRQNYQPQLPECQNALTVDAQGNVVVLGGQATVTEALPKR